jgi:putative Holliday junction resolvase
VSRIGVWLGVDVGSVRVGVARCDPDGRLATPLETVLRDPRRHRDLDRLAALAEEYEAVGVVVGWPRTLRGERGPAADAALAFADALRERIAPRAVELSDERLTTVVARRRMRDAGVRDKAGRAMIDSAAATEILQNWLEGLRSAQTHNPEDR